MSKRPTIYISRSLLYPKDKFNKLVEKLAIIGFKVSYYIEGTTYTDEKLKNADIVLFLEETSEHTSHLGRFSYIGKGQYTEFRLANKLMKDMYVYVDDLLSETFLYKPNDVEIHNEYDWKRRYGIIRFSTIKNTKYDDLASKYMIIKEDDQYILLLL